MVKCLQGRVWKLLFMPLSVLAFAIFGASCGEAVVEKSGGTLKIAIMPDHVTLDPPQLLRLHDIAIIQATNDVLIFRNPDLSIQPALATSWQSNDNGSQWTFQLRKGVHFKHFENGEIVEGKEFKAEDIIFTFNRLFEMNSPLTEVMAKPTDIVAVDDYTVRFEFDGPNAVLLEALVKYHAHITPSDVDPERFAIETFGTGPFIMTEFVIDERATFIKNPDYWWDGHPLVDDLIYIYIPRPEDRAEALTTGVVDAIYDMNASNILTVNDYPETHAAVASSGSYMNLSMIVTEPPFDNKLVRKAVQAATDRQAILQGAQFGFGSIAYDHPITEGDPVFNKECKPPEYNPILAKDLLAQAGYPDGINLTIYTATVGAAMVEMARVLKESFYPAGINLKIVVMPEDEYWSDGWMVKPFTTVWWGGHPPYEAFNIVYAGDASWNEAFWNNVEFNGLLKDALGQGNVAEQMETFGAMQCLVIEEVPRIITVFRPVVLGLRNYVRGLEPMWDTTMSVHRAWLDR